jgi:ribosomal protein S18 acetylase RimI-like enzyme
VIRRELLEEAPRARVIPLLLEMRHPARGEHDRWPLAQRRVGNTPAIELTEANVLFHGPASLMARPGHVNKMARHGEVTGQRRSYPPDMQARYVNGLTVRQLRSGDTVTVSALFERLSERSRHKRFCGAKPRLSELELAELARVDPDHHVLVGYVHGDTAPVGIARLVRDGTSAEIAFAVADGHQGRGIGSTLASELAADARAAGITQLVATVCGDNPRVLAVLKRLGSLDMSWRGRERDLAVGLETSSL